MRRIELPQSNQPHAMSGVVVDAVMRATALLALIGIAVITWYN